VTITMGGGGGTPYPSQPIGSNSPYPTQPPKGSSPTPTPLTVLPPTGLPQDVVTMTVVGSAVALIGSFLVIFLW
jgi:hypothetical protein